MAGIVKNININDILNYYENPRHEVGLNERDTLQKLFHSVGMQYMLNLAEDIQEHGLLGNQYMVVVFSNELGKYVVYEGNRRLAVMKLLRNPDKFDFIDRADLEKAKRIAAKGFTILEIPCYVTDEEEAFFIMERIHSGEDKGRGIKAWSSREKDEFKVRQNHKKSMAYLIDKYAKDFLYGLDITTILPFTTLQRIFNNRKVKKEIGLNVSDESTFTPYRILLVKEAALWVRQESIQRKVSVTRLFNTADMIEEQLLPWICQYKKNNIDADENKREDAKNTTLTNDHQTESSGEGHYINTNPDESKGLSMPSEDGVADIDPEAKGNEKQDGQGKLKSPGKITVRKIKGLEFTKEDVETLERIRNKSNLSAKIYQLAYEISTQDIRKFYCSIIGLYRSLIECATRQYFKTNNNSRSYNESSGLEGNVISVLNELGQKRGMNKYVGMWRETITKRKLIDVLNQYIHNESDIDLDFIEQTWKTMKPYIMICIK